MMLKIEQEDHLLSIIQRCEGLLLEVYIDPARDGIGYHKQRAG